jgi:predicted acylesterase/phospholipase RssA
MAPMIVLNDFDTLREAYTSVTQEAIFNVNPFKADGNLKTLLAVWRLITGKKTFGESHNLRKLIDKFLTKERYDTIVQSAPRKQFTVCTVNYENGVAGYTASEPARSWEEMGNWIWASANEPLFMSFTDETYLKGGTYVDGGVRENIPVIAALDYAKKQGIYDIDIIVNKPRDPIIEKQFKPAGILKNLRRLIELWETEVRNDDIIIAILLSQLGETTVPDITAERAISNEPLFSLNFHYIPAPLYAANTNELIFDHDNMEALWNAGEAGHEDPKSLTVPVKQKQIDIFLEKAGTRRS